MPRSRRLRLDTFPCTIKPTMPKPTFTRDILLAALAGFQLDKQRIDSQIAEVQAMFDGSSGIPAKSEAVSVETPGKTSRKRSAAVRRRMAEAQKARWARIKGEATIESGAPSLATQAAPKAKRQISEEGMKRIIAATKKRWKVQKAAAQAAQAEKAVAKKSAVRKVATAKAAANKVAPVKKNASKKSAAKRLPRLQPLSETQAAGQ
jgi:hypothetical protein